MKILRQTVKSLIYDEESKKILIVRGALFSGGKYSFAGGGLKKGESGEEAVLREIKEETSIDNSVIKEILPIDEKKIFKQKLFFLTIESEIELFLMILSMTPKIKTNWEIKDYLWVLPSEVEKFLNPLSQILFNKAMKQYGAKIGTI